MSVLNSEVRPGGGSGGGDLVDVGEPLRDVPLPPLDQGEGLVLTDLGQPRLLTVLQLHLYLDLSGLHDRTGSIRLPLWRGEER